MRVSRLFILIVPEGYIGRIAIIYNQQKGVKTEYTKDGRRILRIPACGILKTQFTALYGIVSSDAEEDYFKFCYSDNPTLGSSADTITFLKDYSKVDSLPQNGIFIFNRGLGGFGVGNVDYKDVEEFFVDTLKNREKYRSFNFDQVDLDRCN
ncbi:hypothetical protein CJD36_017155 [Flavipsychrobacter stenotrophus]|uniref:DUF6843 domain-containing protein n=1 Tax=Flavipsychrobacter stenotrophus TaxID=2077091 RepID=A0A2S7SRX2_9BACT|nr:hypothetical protein [Flavipsychrobacter stenotrophus]PQJ09663.1 hypothetical protein CJD36_017155 [Flavipsychrobacter stenotrophus]